MNWGKGLTIGMVIFMSFIITLTTIMMRKSSDLESEDYYSREVNYEQEIQAQRNANLQEKIAVNHDEEYVVLTIPETLNVPGVKVLFIRPNDKLLDKEFQFEGTKTLLISKKELKEGRYKLEITYQLENKDCLQKEEITI